MSKRIDKWNSQKDKDNKGNPKGVKGDNHKGKKNSPAGKPPTPPSTLPKSTRVDSIRVDDDLDLAIFDDLQPDQEFVINPTGVVADDILQAVMPAIEGNPPSWQPISPAAIAVTTDGVAPASSPTASGNVVGGTGILVVDWTAVSNADPVTYEVHVSTASGFTPSGSTLQQETPATHAIITTEADGTPLELDTPYYVKLIAKDADGSAAAGAQGTDSINRLATDHLETDGGTPAFVFDPVTRAGPGWLKVQWLLPSGTDDPLFYNVFIDTTPGFSINFSTNYVGMTFGNDMVIGALADDSVLESTTDYYIRVQAVSDLSGNTGLSNEVGPVSPEILDGTITTISNLDAGNITVGFLDGDRIDANTVRADALIADDAMFNTVSSLLVETNTLIIGDPATYHVTAGQDGVFLMNGGESIVSMPLNGDPAVFRGTLIADELTVISGATFQGTGNVLDEGSKLTLLGTQGDPTIAPMLSSDVAVSVTFTGNPWTIQDTSGLFYDSTNTSFWRLVNRQSNGQAYIQEFDSVTGAYVRSKQIASEWGVTYAFIGVGESGGICRIGSYVYVYIPEKNGGGGGNYGWLLKFNESDLTFVSSAYVGGTIGQPNEAFSGALGTDGTDLYLVATDQGDPTEVCVHKYNTSLVWQSSVTSSGFSWSGGDLLSGIVKVGSQYFIARRHYLSGTYDYVDAISTTTGVVNTNERFYPQAQHYNRLCGLTHDGTNFYTLRLPATENPTIHKHTEFLANQSENNAYVAYRWDTGAVHTKVSNQGVLNLASPTSLRRRKITITVPTPPSGMVSQIFIKLASSPPADTALLRQTATTYISTESSTAIVWNAYDTGGTALTTDTNTFGAGNSSIEAQASGITAPWKLKGDGAFILPNATHTERASAYASPVEAQQLYMDDTHSLEIYDGTAHWWPTGGFVSPPFGMFIYEDFMTGALVAGERFGNWVCSQTGAGATPPSWASVDVANHIGVTNLTTGNGSTAECRMALNSVGRIGEGRVRFGVLFNLNTTKPSTANNYVVGFGLSANLSNSPVAAAVNQVEITIDRIDDSTTRLRGRVNNGGTAVTRDLNANMSTNTWYLVECEINAGATSIQFYLDGVATGAAVTTNIPTGQNFLFRLEIVKTAGTTSRDCMIDYAYLHKALTTPR